jgi:hypothetical protein
LSESGTEDVAEAPEQDEQETYARWRAFFERALRDPAPPEAP